MLLNKTFISALLAIALGFATPVQAQEIRTLKDYLDNCIPQEEEDEDLPEECDRLREAHESRQSDRDDLETEEVEDLDPDSPRRERRSQPESESSGGIGGYAGAVLGVYFPDIDEERPFFTGNDVDIDTGFGSSLFAGISFNRYLATDIEIGALAGNVDSDLDEDENYLISGIYLNPRFTLPLTGNKNSLALYLSPGIGVSQLSTSVEDETDDDFDRTTVIEDDSRFTWQIKAGVSIPVSRKFSILTQLRYTSQTGDNAVDYFGTELGIKFDF